jgi:hypothetical protein
MVAATHGRMGLLRGHVLYGQHDQASVKDGDYEPDTTTRPYASLHAYKGSLPNGIWATAPYLHNGSVPTLGICCCPATNGQNHSRSAPASSIRTSRIQSADYDGTQFNTDLQRGNYNTARKILLDHASAAGQGRRQGHCRQRSPRPNWTAP